MRIGMLTSGGDCQSLNASMRGVAKSLYENLKDVEIIGFLEGYKGLIYGNYRKMETRDFSGILTEGGTIIGTSRQPFKLMRTPDANGLDKVKAMKDNYKKLGLECLVILGGNGTHKTANLLRDRYYLWFPERSEYRFQRHRLYSYHCGFPWTGIYSGSNGT